MILKRSSNGYLSFGGIKTDIRCLYYCAMGRFFKHPYSDGAFL
ncbi:hypothetical protein PSKAS_35530 [Peribacillus sp. N1]